MLSCGNLSHHEEALQKRGEKKTCSFERWGDTLCTYKHWGSTFHVIVHVLLCQLVQDQTKKGRGVNKLGNKKKKRKFDHVILEQLSVQGH